MRALRLAAALPATAFLPLPAGAQEHGATATGEASAAIVQPLSVRQLADLDFGIVASDAAAGGSVAVSPGSDVRYLGRVRNGCGGSGDCPVPHTAQFSVTGEMGRSYAIEVPERLAVSGVSATGQAIAPVLVVSGFSVKTESWPDSGAAGELGPGGSDRFELGGTLNVPAGLRPARYSTTVDVLVTYR